jgi:CTP:molybdopterin cytidylyltransferase MocA
MPGNRPTTAGLVLAAGQGSRMGAAKAIVPHPEGGVLVEHAISVLRDAGCAPVVVVLGADATRAAPFAGGADHVIVAQDWARGQSESLRAGLEALSATQADSVAVLLVDLPDVGSEVIRRVLSGADDARTRLARASYRGAPGHPVVIGRDHWDGVMQEARGDQGARRYIAARAHRTIECGDLATGRDVDTPDDLGAYARPDRRV